MTKPQQVGIAKALAAGKLIQRLPVGYELYFDRGERKVRIADDAADCIRHLFRSVRSKSLTALHRETGWPRSLIHKVVTSAVYWNGGLYRDGRIVFRLPPIIRSAPPWAAKEPERPGRYLLRPFIDRVNRWG